ncbi:hypothetical protein KGQ20_22025 [Catenulispora sp. NF23]|nr:alpha/beta hydrolase-fold protein [Catenulispora pinistramenti]MBS2535445.1 hypothetical protein [Catenulispora pinistramenti]
MRRSALLAAFGTVTALSLAMGAVASGDVRPVRAPVPRARTAVDKGTVEVLHVSSADAGPRSRDVYVYRPGVTATSALPVLYMLHGYPGHPAALMRWMAPMLDTAFERGAAPFIVAVPDGNSTAHSDTEWADSVDGRTLVESSLIRRILPAVEGPTPRSAGMRAIGGFSIGGYGAMNLGLRHPDLFGQVVSVSGYFRVDDTSGMFAKHRAAIAANTPDTMVRAASGRRFLLIESKNESEPLIAGQAADFAGRLRSCHCAGDVELRMERGDHNVDFVGAQTPAIVAFLDAGWRRPVQ